MTSVAMPRRSSCAAEAPAATEPGHPLRWYLAAALVSFAIPLVGADVLELHHDLYLLVYFTVAGTFLASFAAHVSIDWRGWLGTRRWWSVGAGLLVAFAIVRKVLSEAAMPHPEGSFFWFELAWRGVAYGLVDALLLFVFPGAVAYALLGDRDRHRRVRYAALSLVLSFGITAGYHLGYPQFRSTDLVQPEIGAVVAWVPTALTGNSLGVIVVHDAYHAAANVHRYHSEIYLPPDLDGYAERGSGTAGPALAGAWVVLAGGAVYLARCRLFPAGSER